MEELSKEDLFFAAKVLISEKHNQMALKYVQQAIDISAELSTEEQNIFIAAHRNLITPLRATIRKLNEIYNEQLELTESQGDSLTHLQTDIFIQMGEVVESIITIINEKLLPSTISPPDQCLYHIVAGDFCRYIAETGLGEWAAAGEDSMNEYDAAIDIATNNLPMEHPIHLTALLQKGILIHDVTGTLAEAVAFMENAFNKVAGLIDNLTDQEQLENANVITGLMRDNIIQWSTLE